MNKLLDLVKQYDEAREKQAAKQNRKIEACEAKVETFLKNNLPLSSSSSLYPSTPSFKSKNPIPSTSQEVILNKAENAWKPFYKDGKKKADPKESEMEEFRRKALAILNKLTLKKLKTLVQKFQELPIDSHQKLSTCMELVFDKAVDEPSFSVAYALLCKELQRKKVPDELKPEENVIFRKLLISRYYFKTLNSSI